MKRLRHEMTDALSALPDFNLVEDNDPPDPLARRITIVEAKPADMIKRMAALPPDVIVEPEILHWIDAVPPPDFPVIRGGESAQPAAVGPTEALTVTVVADGQPLPNAAVGFYLQGSVEPLAGRTKADGRADFLVALGARPAAAVVEPAGSYWTMVVRGAAVTEPIVCPKLPADGPLGWWHKLLGIDDYDSALGTGIRVGVADTGAGPHTNLGHAIQVGAYVNGAIMPAAQAADVAAHGTHVSGTIGARPTNAHDYAGLAPGCELFVSRVFAGPKSGASNADIANAIDELSRDKAVDLINLSLGAKDKSQIVQDAIIDAAERGTLCICAAGNSGGPVMYPAALPETVAVAAVGLAGWGPAGSLSASRLPIDQSLFGNKNLYAASFTCHGPEIACAAPGVGIIATVPNHFGADMYYGGMDGTSMASPVICGALAASLSRDAAYKALPRDISRTNAARTKLNGLLQDLGLPPSHQGRGAPSLLQAIA